MKKRVRRKPESIQVEQYDGSGPTVFQCPMEYQPGRDYIRQEIIDLIEPHGELLCFFAECAKVRRCVLGIDFDHYDSVTQMLPVYVFNEAEVETLGRLEGEEFRRAYRQSGPGRSVIVTFTGKWWRGWFVLKWQLPAHRFEM
jgi:hypothetical protein